MRNCLGFLILFVVAPAFSETPAGTLWSELRAKREKLAGLHQEFEVTQISKTKQGVRSSKRTLTVDMAQGRWREQSLSGSADRIRIFDGQDVMSMDEGGDEYVREKRKAKDDEPLPAPYGFGEADWSKAPEVRTRRCAIPGNDHECAVLEAPLKGWARPASYGHIQKLLEGTVRAVVDMETGAMISLETVQLVDMGTSVYQNDIMYALKRMSYGVPADLSLFALAWANMREVRELSKWNAARIRKQLAGKPAPEFAVTDLRGSAVNLSAYKGKTVLLDFWATWCPPCRADGPALDKLYKKYGEKDLMIVGVSVNEDRTIVERYLNEHPHSYPIVLTAENELPRAYQVGVLPTYIVIDRDGTVTAAVEGDRGFGDLRHLLKKAGLESE